MGNVPVITSDQHNMFVLGCGGDDHARRPNIDALATTGMVEDTIAILSNELGDMLGGYSVPSEEMIEIARVGVGS
ncbi:MAG: hypothetical protein P8N50_13795 [Actinomycetota bacterium]|nr:hypothetical protein [Actinomycetota bacterium]